MGITPIVFPSLDGLTQFSVYVQPVSSQSSGARKKKVIEAIRAITSQVESILTSDVQIEIAWYINELERYETDQSADADNIIKPIVDALSGPDGLFVNDCQVQSVLSYWLDRDKFREHIDIQLRYLSDSMFFKKESLSFVKIKDGLCFPINTSLTSEQIRAFLNIFETQISTRQTLLEKGVDVESAQYVMPIQRVFHVSRCHGFPVMTIDDLRKSI